MNVSYYFGGGYVKIEGVGPFKTKPIKANLGLALHFVLVLVVAEGSVQ